MSSAVSAAESCAVLDITHNYWRLLLPGLESEREHVTFQVFPTAEKEKKRAHLEGNLLSVPSIHGLEEENLLQVVPLPPRVCIALSNK